RHRGRCARDRPKTPARRAPGRQQRASRQKNPRRIRPHDHQWRHHGRRGAESCESGWEIIVMLQITELAFTCSPVIDMARARKFYENPLGLKPTMFFGEPGGMQWTEYDIASGT